MGLLFYTIFLQLYPLGVRIASFWNKKASLWIRGRKDIFRTIQNAFAIPPGEERTVNKQVLWMHCASLGEFEQGRPLIESLRKLNPGIIIVVTFFSPSGYEVQKNYKGADHIFYLPMDSAYNARKFISLVNPTLVLWVKYEFWYHYLHELKKNNIPVLMVSGAFRAGQPFFKWYGPLWKKMLSSFTRFFVQNTSSKHLLESIQVNNVTVSGDTRFDRVKTVAENFDEIPLIRQFCGDAKVIVAGSTWEDDEAELIHYAKTNKDIKFIIAPHEVDNENLKVVKKEFTGSVFFSDLTEENINSGHIVIINNIGMLSRLYKYADITYVGGGFGYDGLHNILEAAVYGKPVIFGPEIEKNFEAVELTECGGGIIIENALDLEKTLKYLFDNPDELQKSGRAAKDYVYKNAGATATINNYIQEKRLLTS